MQKEYIRSSKSWPMTKRTEEHTIEVATRLRDKYKNNESMVFYKETIQDEDFSRAAFTDACKHFPDSQELRKVMQSFGDLHESRYMKNATLWVYKEGIAKMVLTNAHGREDKKKVETNQEIKISDEDQKMIDEVLDANL